MRLDEFIIALIEASKGDLTREVAVYDIDIDADAVSDYTIPVVDVTLDPESQHIIVLVSVK